MECMKQLRLLPTISTTQIWQEIFTKECSIAIFAFQPGSSAQEVEIIFKLHPDMANDPEEREVVAIMKDNTTRQDSSLLLIFHSSLVRHCVTKCHAQPFWMATSLILKGDLAKVTVTSALVAGMLTQAVNIFGVITYKKLIIVSRQQFLRPIFSE